MAGPELLTDLLKQVSRSFYLTLRVLPGAVRPPIGLAYLLARATDTIADTDLVPVEDRLAALDLLKARILGTSAAALDFSRFAPQATPSPREAAERLLLENIESALEVLKRQHPEDRQRIREVLATITSGQEMDLRRFGQRPGVRLGRPGGLAALQTDAELDDYTYRVAGCVGEFWTKMCRAHLFPRVRVDDSALLANGVRFGKGLQLVNILRDVPADLRLGRCYLPATALSELGLAPADLLEPAHESRLRPLYDRYLALAEDHLAAGWTYTNTLPWRCARVRLACAWPVLIGISTLARLRHGHVLDPAHRIKVSRGDVWRIIAGTVLLYPIPMVWRRQFFAVSQRHG